MRSSMLVDQTLYLIIHHPLTTMALAAAAGVLSWLLTQARNPI